MKHKNIAKQIGKGGVILTIIGSLIGFLFGIILKLPFEVPYIVSPGILCGCGIITMIVSAFILNWYEDIL